MVVVLTSLLPLWYVVHAGAVMAHFDKDGSGEVDCSEFLLEFFKLGKYVLGIERMIICWTTTTNRVGLLLFEVFFNEASIAPNRPAIYHRSIFWTAF